MPFKGRFKAFTLVELLVVLVIFLVVGTILFYLLIKALRWTSTTAGGVKQQLSVDVNTDLLVFDLKHAGYGISRNESKPVIEYPFIKGDFSAENKTLAIRETTNVLDTQYSSDDKDYGCGFLISQGGSIIYNNTCGNPYNDNAVKCVWLTLDKYYEDYGNCSNAPSSGDYIGFPVDTDSVCKGGDYCCQEQYCTTIFWYLKEPDWSSESAPKKCKPLETKVLYRTVTNSTGDLQAGKPIVNCVSDWDIWFGFDTDNDTKVDTWSNSTSGKTNEDLKNRLKVAKIYMLVQSSYTADPHFDFCNMTGIDCDNTTTCGNGYIKVDRLGTDYVCLKHPSDPSWKHYHWKIIEITVSGFPNIP